MSVSSLFYIILGQVIFSKMWHWFPISGYGDGISSLRFIALPIAISIFAGLGSTTRWYRSIFLEEINREYISKRLELRGYPRFRYYLNIYYQMLCSLF